MKRYASIIIGIISFYFWTVASGSIFSHWIEDPTPKRASFHYNHLTNGLLRGQLNLYFPTQDDILSEKYNPTEYNPNKIDDITPFNGKYYLYFGVVPAILLFLPFKLLTGWSLPQELACWIVVSGGFIFAFLLMQMLVRRFFFKSRYLLWIIIPALGLSCCALQMLRRPRHYELAISSGNCFLMGGLYFGFRAILELGARKVNLILMSILFICAIGSRPPAALTIAIFLCFYFSEYIGGRIEIEKNQKQAIVYLSLTVTFIKEHLLTIFAPMGMGLFGLLLYNKMRFGNWLEFGMSILVTSYNRPQGWTFSATFLPLNIAHYLFRPYPEVSGGIPIIAKTIAVLSKYYEGMTLPHLSSHYLNLEPTFGLLFMNPFSFLGLLWLSSSIMKPELLTSSGVKTSGFFGIRGYGLFFLISSLATLLFLSTLSGVCQRYHYDFVILFFFSAVLAWLTLLEQFETKTIAAQLGFKFATIGLLCFGIYISSTTYVQCHQDLTGLRTWINRNLIYTHSNSPKRLLEIAKQNIALLIQFSTEEKGKREPLLVAGSLLEADMVYVKYLGEHQIQFGVNHWGMKESEGDPVDAIPSVFHKLDFLLGFQYPKPQYLGEASLMFPFLKDLYLSDNQALIRILMDGQIVLNTYTPYFEASRHSIKIGNNPFGGGFVSEHFTGTLIK